MASISIKSCYFIFFCISLFFLALFPFVSASEKPVQGFIFDDSGPLQDTQIKLMMKFKQGESEIVCLTYPTIFTDDRGYFITNLANLRVLGNNNPCEDKWKKGEVLGVIAKGYLTTLSDGDLPLIDSESGAALTFEKLILTSEQFEPLYSELSLAKMSISSLDYIISRKSKNAVFTTGIHNPNNVGIDELFLKIVVTEKDDRNAIVDIIEQKTGITAFEDKQVQVVWDINDIETETYFYNAVLYTSAATHDQIFDQEITIKSFFGLLTPQTLLILLLIGVIIFLIIKLAYSGKFGKQKGI